MAAQPNARRDHAVRVARASRSRHRSASPPTAAAAPAGPGRGGMGGGGMGRMGGGGMGAALAPTPELLEKVAKLPPPVDRPDVDVVAQTRLERPFRFSHFLRPFRWPLVAGLILVTLDGLATLAGPWLIRFGINEGVGKDAQAALWAASAAFLAITLADWWVMWAQTRVMGRTSERMLFALRVKLFAHLQRLGIDYFEREMAGRVMTRMTTDIDSLSQFLQTGLVTALVNVITLVGVAVALVFMDWELALATSVDPAAADRRDDLVPTELEPRLRPGPRQHRRGQREPPGGPLRGAGLPGVRPGGHEPAGVRDRGARVPERPARGPEARRDVLPVRRDALRARRRARARASAACCSPTTRCSRDADRVPALPRPLLRPDPAAEPDVRRLPAGPRLARPRSTSCSRSRRRSRPPRYRWSPRPSSARSPSTTSCSGTRRP